MPLSIRPFKDSDATPLVERFAAGGRPPWLRLPYPYDVDQIVDAESRIDVFVATPSAGHVVGLLGFDRRQEPPLLLGPLVQDEQLADLYVRGLLAHGLGWAREAGLERVRVKVDLGVERALQLFLNQGFRLLDDRDYLLAARKTRRPLPTPIEGIRFGLSPEMLSSDYLRLYQEIGQDSGWTERLAWGRPQIFEHLQSPGVHLISARAGETYLGFAELAADGEGGAELQHFGLLPAFRGRGVGAAFLDHVLHYAFEQLGFTRVWTSGSASPERGAVGFLERHGFKQDRAMVHLEKVFEPAASGVGATSAP